LTQIAQLKYYMNFSLYEIGNMTAEDREFYLKWFADMKTKERESEQRSAGSKSDIRLGPSA
jgi:hypothetical protein